MMRCIVYNNESHETWTILSNVVTVEEVTKSMGCVALRIEYLLRTFPMTRSACIWMLAMFCVCSTTTPSNCFFFVCKLQFPSVNNRGWQSHWCWSHGEQVVYLQVQGFLQEYTCTVLGNVFVTSSTSPTFGNKTHSSLRSDPYQILNSIMMFVYKKNTFVHGQTSLWGIQGKVQNSQWLQHNLRNVSWMS